MKIIGGENTVTNIVQVVSCLGEKEILQTTHISLCPRSRGDLLYFNNAFNFVPFDIFIKEQRLGFKQRHGLRQVSNSS